jgi:hypothetical protein
MEEEEKNALILNTYPKNARSIYWMGRLNRKK